MGTPGQQLTQDQASEPGHRTFQCFQTGSCFLWMKKNTFQSLVRHGSIEIHPPWFVWVHLSSLLLMLIRQDGEADGRDAESSFYLEIRSSHSSDLT